MGQIELFKCLSVFDPYQAKHMDLDASKLQKLAEYPAFAPYVDGLINELPKYLAILNQMNEFPSPQDQDILDWFKEKSQFDDLRIWGECTRLCALFQPSSGASERFFSLLDSLHSTERTHPRKNMSPKQPRWLTLMRWKLVTEAELRCFIAIQ